MYFNAILIVKARGGGGLQYKNARMCVFGI